MNRPRAFRGPQTWGLAALLCLLFSLSLLLPDRLVVVDAEPGQEIQALEAEPDLALTGGDEPTRTVSELLPGERLDLNRASAEELKKLPGIGEKLADAIVAYREEHGAFGSVDELLQIPGIGEKRLAALRDLVTADAG